MKIPATKSSGQKAFVSAAAGNDLGHLPKILADRQISWEWAKDLNFEEEANQYAAIKDADVFIGVISGFRSDYRVVYEIGIAAALEKQILIISSPKRKIPIDFSKFNSAYVSLDDFLALSFHIDAFLSKRKPSVFSHSYRTPFASSARTPQMVSSSQDLHFESNLEKRVADIIMQNGGTAVTQPASPESKSYRPDILMWLDIEADGLPEAIVIEVKARADARSIRPIEDRLIGFMNTTGLRVGLVITEHSVPERSQPLWPSLFWLDLSTFRELMTSGELGSYMRIARNRAVHGVK